MGFGTGVMRESVGIDLQFTYTQALRPEPRMTRIQVSNGWNRVRFPIPRLRND
jgi:hypothetical protein